MAAGPVEEIEFAVSGALERGLRVGIATNPTLYTEADLAAHARRLLTLWETVPVADPDAAVGVLDLLPPTERHLVLVAPNDTAHGLPDAKSGARHLPLDLDYPTDRIRYMLADAAPALALTDAGTERELPDSDVPRLSLDSATVHFGHRPLRHRVTASLPDHMVPAAFVMLKGLPVTPSGELDRAALPAPQRTATATRAPRTPQQAVLCGLSGEVPDVPSPRMWDPYIHGTVEVRQMLCRHKDLGQPGPPAAVGRALARRAERDHLSP